MPKRFSSREIARQLRADGWYEVRQSGSHRHFRHPTKPGVVTLPEGRKDMPPGTLRSIERQASLRFR